MKLCYIMRFYTIVQGSMCITGFVLFIYGIVTLPQPVTTTLTSRADIQQLNDEYSSLVIHSRQFLLAMIGIGILAIGIVCISACRPRDVSIAPDSQV